jgi:hypothetical protein
MDLQKQRLIDRRLHLVVVGIVLFQSARDLLRREVVTQLVRNRVVQSLVLLQFPRFRGVNPIVVPPAISGDLS